MLKFTCLLAAKLQLSKYLHAVELWKNLTDLTCCASSILVLSLPYSFLIGHIIWSKIFNTFSCYNTDINIAAWTLMRKRKVQIRQQLGLVYCNQNNLISYQIIEYSSSNRITNQCFSFIQLQWVNNLPLHNFLNKFIHDLPIYLFILLFRYSVCRQCFLKSVQIPYLDCCHYFVCLFVCLIAWYSSHVPPCHAGYVIVYLPVFSFNVVLSILPPYLVYIVTQRLPWLPVIQNLDGIRTKL